MTDLSAPCPSYTSAVTVEGRKILIVLAVAAFADWLFFRHPFGISIAVFLAAIAGATSVANPFRASPKESAIAVGILLAGLAPLALRTSLLACLVGVAATAYAALVIADPDRGGGWRARIAKSFWLLVDGSWQGFADVAAIQGDRCKVRAGQYFQRLSPAGSFRSRSGVFSSCCSRRPIL
jgi:hypothetical protein